MQQPREQGKTLKSHLTKNNEQPEGAQGKNNNQVALLFFGSVFGCLIFEIAVHHVIEVDTFFKACFVGCIVAAFSRTAGRQESGLKKGLRLFLCLLALGFLAGLGLVYFLDAISHFSGH